MGESMKDSARVQPGPSSNSGGAGRPGHLSLRCGLARAGGSNYITGSGPIGLPVQYGVCLLDSPRYRIDANSAHFYVRPGKRGQEGTGFNYGLRTCSYRGGRPDIGCAGSMRPRGSLLPKGLGAEALREAGKRTACGNSCPYRSYRKPGKKLYCPYPGKRAGE